MPDEKYLIIPNCLKWNRDSLLKQTKLLYEDFIAIIKDIINIKSGQDIERAIIWFSEKFDKSIELGKEKPFTLCTAFDFEKKVGKLLVRERIELPDTLKYYFKVGEG